LAITFISITCPSANFNLNVYSNMICPVHLLFYFVQHGNHTTSGCNVNTKVHAPTTRLFAMVYSRWGKTGVDRRRLYTIQIVPTLYIRTKLYEVNTCISC
jgi:hypothetical protein